MLKKILISFTLISLFGCSTDGEIVHKPHYLVDIENVVVVREDWNVNVGEPDYRRIQKLQPFLFKNKIYTVGTKGKINIFDLHGKRLKSHKLPYEASSIATDGQLIVVTTIDGNIIAFSNKDFTQKWLVRLKSEVLVKVLFVEDKVLVRSSLGKITALSAFDGASQWTYQQQTPVLSSRGSSNMVLDDHKVIVGFDNGYLSVINPINGKAFWEKLLSETEGQTELDRINDIDTQLLVENGYVYFIGNDNYLNKYNIKTAQRVWRVKQSSTKKLGIELYIYKHGDNEFNYSNKYLCWLRAFDTSGTDEYQRERLMAFDLENWKSLSVLNDNDKILYKSRDNKEKLVLDRYEREEERMRTARHIRKDKKWLAKVEKQAEERKIPLDSMLILTVDYVMKNQKKD